MSPWKVPLAGFQDLIACRYSSHTGFGNGLDFVAVQEQRPDDDTSESSLKICRTHIYAMETSK